MNKQFNRIIGLFILFSLLFTSSSKATSYNSNYKLNLEPSHISYQLEFSDTISYTNHLLKLREYKSNKSNNTMIYRKQRMSYKKLYSIVENILIDIPELKPTEDFIKLIVETIIAESDGGWYFDIKKFGGLGIAQFNYKTAEYLLSILKSRKEEIYDTLESYRKEELTLRENLIHNINFNVAMCAVYYYHRRGKQLYKEIGTIDKRANLWKRVYNTEEGIGTPELYKQRVNMY